jgi:hypothetical protein
MFGPIFPSTPTEVSYFPLIFHSFFPFNIDVGLLLWAEAGLDFRCYWAISPI